MISTVQYVRTLDGIDIAYTIYKGKKELQPLLFLHGWGGSKDSFRQLIEAFEVVSNGFHGDIFVIDFPGFGESPEPPTAWSIQEYARCVAQYIDAIGITHIHIVCHSFGGRVTAILLNQLKTLCVSSTCIAPAGIYHESKKALLGAYASKLIAHIERYIDKKYTTILRRYARRLLGARDYSETSDSMKETFKKVVAHDITPLLNTITQPVQLFFGKRDSYVPIRDAQIWHSAIANSTLTIFDDGRHGLHYTHTTQIASAMYDFLRTPH